MLNGRFALRVGLALSGVLCLMACEPAGQGGTVAFRINEGRYEIAVGVCPDDTFDRIQVYEYSQESNPDRDLLLWDAVAEPPLQGPTVVSVLGDDGEFGYVANFSLRSPLPEEMFVIQSGEGRTASFYVNLAEFKLAGADEFWRDGEMTPRSELRDQTCPNE